MKIYVSITEEWIWDNYLEKMVRMPAPKGTHVLTEDEKRLCPIAYPEPRWIMETNTMREFADALREWEQEVIVTHVKADGAGDECLFVEIYNDYRE